MTSSRTSPETFPFGRPVLPRAPSASCPRPLFILGAYPSALHVAWTPPEPFRSIKAIAVDNEPEPFWTGADEIARIETWKSAVRFDSERWGAVVPTAKLNGSSGAWVEENVLRPLGANRTRAWVTDCLDTYRCSDGLRDRLDDTYRLFAEKFHLSQAVLAPHPSESEIVAEALRDHRKRLLEELDAARPEVIVTLGNAALAVARELLTRIGGTDTRKLSPDAETYGSVMKVRVGDRDVDLLPLAHPAAPPAYQATHATWIAGKPGR